MLNLGARQVLGETGQFTNSFCNFVAYFGLFYFPAVYSSTVVSLYYSYLFVVRFHLRTLRFFSLPIFFSWLISCLFTFFAFRFIYCFLAYGTAIVSNLLFFSLILFLRRLRGRFLLHQQSSYNQHKNDWWKPR